MAEKRNGSGEVVSGKWEHEFRGVDLTMEGLTAPAGQLH